MKKWILSGWVLLGGLVILAAFILSRESFTLCWDGLEVDSDMLMEMCGITEAEYYSGNYDSEACPNAEDAVRMIGECEPDMPAVWAATAVTALVYGLVSGAVWMVVRLVLRLFRPPAKE